MKIAVITLTKRGTSLALKLERQLETDIYVRNEFFESSNENKGNVFSIDSTLAVTIEKIFKHYDSFVFIMACGIVVRTIAPLIKSKTSDPAILVIDEKGQYVISLLSGHIGGANRLAVTIAEKLGGTPVITTSTDVNRMISFDVFAVENNCVIENINDLKYISSELVNGGKVGFYTDCRLKGEIPENICLLSELSEKTQENLKKLVVLSNRTDIPETSMKVLLLRPKNLVLGIGCKQGTAKVEIKNAIEAFLLKNKKSLLAIKCLATIDLKKNEEGLLEACYEYGLELKIIPRFEIESIEKDYTYSEFVKKKVGIASVAEPCSVLGAIKGRLICKKTVYPGITLALSEEENEYNL